MAIEKDYLTTYGWTAKNAYFKIDHIIEKSDDNCEMIFFIYLNKKNRDENPDKPLIRNRVNFKLNKDLFDSNLDYEMNLKTQGYEFLKTSTRGFIRNSINV